MPIGRQPPFNHSITERGDSDVPTNGYDLDSNSRHQDRPMTENEIFYRGYKVTLERDWSGRYLAISPTRPDLPIISRHSSLISKDLMNDEALQHAERRIDAMFR